MARTRLIKPEFFKHGDLYDAEARSKLPLRIAFAGLWCTADKAGRFVWKPRELKLDILPYDDVDFGKVLRALESAGFIKSYTGPDGRTYGYIPSWGRHQSTHKTERPSTLPEPPDNGETTVNEPCGNGESTCRDDSLDVTSRVDTVTVTGAGTVTDELLSSDTPTREARAGEVAAVLTHYRDRHPRTRPDTPANRRRIRARLAEGFTVAELCAAVDGNADDDWHRRIAKHGLSYVFASADAVDRFRALHDADAAPAVGPDGTITAEARQALGMAS